jgi:hypothetical protein
MKILIGVLLVVLVGIEMSAANSWEHFSESKTHFEYRMVDGGHGCRIEENPQSDVHVFIGYTVKHCTMYLSGSPFPANLIGNSHFEIFGNAPAISITDHSVLNLP